MVGVTVLTKADIQDYVDERASPEIIRAVEELVEQDWRVAQLVSAYREQVADMYRAFGCGADMVPSCLSKIVCGAVRTR